MRFVVFGDDTEGVGNFGVGVGGELCKELYFCADS